jgi:hypothetical protein
MHRTAAFASFAAVLAAGAVAVPSSALAQTPAPAAATIHIDNCHVKQSRNAGGFTWAYCAIVADAPAGQNISVKWSSNLATYIPVKGGDWDARTGTMTLGGDSFQSIKIAFKKLTVAQVTSRLKVTLSGVTGGTISDGTATATSGS